MHLCCRLLIARGSPKASLHLLQRSSLYPASTLPIPVCSPCRLYRRRSASTKSKQLEREDLLSGSQLNGPSCGKVSQDTTLAREDPELSPLSASSNCIRLGTDDGNEILTVLDDVGYDAPSHEKESPVLPLQSEEKPSIIDKLLALYFQHLGSPLDRDADKPTILKNRPGFRHQRYQNLLKKSSFTVEDVATWAWIINTRSSKDAALRLLCACNQKRGHSYQAVPFLVLRKILRRKHLDVPTLKLLLIHASDWVFQRHNPAYESILGIGEGGVKSKGYKISRKSTFTAKYASISREEFIDMTRRFIYHARILWAVGLPQIAALVVAYYSKAMSDTNQPIRSLQKDTGVFNELLWLFAQPSSQRPFLSVPYHQRAQFKILRFMSQSNPPILLNRKGHRAIIQLQLAHRKTSREREWAKLKAKSWPPWRQERSGLDAKIGVEYGITRAGQALMELNQAGYGTHIWEKAAGVVAGFDADLKPTIQTRYILKAPSTEGFDMHRRADSEVPLVDQTEDASAIWAARIQATRTLDEAWFRFLSYRSSNCPVSSEPYFVMACKIVYARWSESHDKRSRGRRPISEELPYDGLSSLPGDHLEVCLPPRDPRERVYVKYSPPDLSTFLQDAVSDGVVFGNRFLAFLIRQSSTIAECKLYLEQSSLTLPAIDILLGRAAAERATLEKIPRIIFAAYIKFLCDMENFEITGKYYHIENALFSKRTRGRVDRPLELACILVKTLQPKYLPPWNHLLGAATQIANWLSSPVTVNVRYLEQATRAWAIVVRLLDLMDGAGVQVDWAAFRCICVVYTQAARAAAEIIEFFDTTEQVSSNERAGENKRHSGEAYITPRVTNPALYNHAEKILSDGLTLVKELFFEAAGSAVDEKLEFPALVEKQVNYSDDDTIEGIRIGIARVFEAPSPSHLHAFVRALGTSGDFDGLLALGRWMVKFAPELNEAKAESANGDYQLRNALIAMRVYLEGDLVRELTADMSKVTRLKFKIKQAPFDIVEQIEALIRSRDEWLGWPTDREVESYLEGQTNK